MAVDLETHRCRIGCFRHINGTDVITISVTVNVAMVSKTLCTVVCYLLAALAFVWNVPCHLESICDTSLDVKTTVGLGSSVLWICCGKVGQQERLIGAVIFIHLLLLAAGVEPNPGPERQCFETTQNHHREKGTLLYTVLLLSVSAITFHLNWSVISENNEYLKETRHLSTFDNKAYGCIVKLYEEYKGTSVKSNMIQRTCSFLLGNKGAHMTNGNPHTKGDVTLGLPTLELLERKGQESVGFIRIHTEPTEDNEPHILHATGTGFRVGDCYLMSAYHVFRNKIENLIDNITMDLEKSTKELQVILNIEDDISIESSSDVIKMYLKINAVDVSLLMRHLDDNVSDRFKSNEKDSWTQNCVVDFIDDNKGLKHFSVDWKIIFGNEEKDVVIVKLIQTTNEQMMPEQLSLAETFEVPDKVFIVRFMVEDQPEVVLDDKCILFKDNDELENEVVYANNWWKSNFPSEFDTTSYDVCMKSHDPNTGRVIIRAAETFIGGSSGSPLFYLNRHGYVTVGAIYQRGFPLFYYKRMEFWNREIERKTGKPVDKKVLFEGCTTLQKVAELLVKHGKLDLKKNMFNDETAIRQNMKEQVIADIRRNKGYDEIFHNIKITSESPVVQLQYVIRNSIGPREPTEIMRRTIESWEKDEKNFIETEATTFIHNRIRDSNIVTIVGCAGSGKSFAMHHAALELQKEGFSLFVFRTCSEVLQYINIGQGKQLFLLDNPIGEDEVDKQKVREWRSDGKYIYNCVTESRKLVVTIRKEILKELTYHVSDFVFSNGQIDLESKELRMNSIERNAYFSKAVIHKNLIESVSFYLLSLIKECELPNFPLLVHIYCTDNYFQKHPSEIFQDLLAAFENRLQRMWENNKEQFCGLALLSINKGETKLDTFDRFGDETTEEVKNAKEILRKFDLTCSLASVGDELEKLEGIYVEKCEHCYVFKHKEFKSLVDYVIGKRYRGFTVNYCDTEFILKRCKLSRQSEHFETTEYKYKITIPESSEERLASAFLSSIQNNDLGSKIFASDFCKDEKFLRTMKAKMEVLEMEEENREKFQYQILCNACWYNYSDIIGSLTREYKCKSFTGLTPLMACAYAGNTIDLERFLDRDDNIDLEFNGYTALGFAVSMEQRTTVNMLLLKHCNVNRGYRTPLSIAASLGNEYFVTLLLKHRADINKLDGDGNSALALGTHNKSIVSLLLRYRADVNKCGTKLTSKTPLHHACYVGSYDVVNLLLDNEANVNLMNSAGNTALTVAILAGNESIARFLINYPDTDVNLLGTGPSAMSPISAACGSGFIDIVNILLEKKAKINSSNMSPIICCCYMERYDIADVLLKYGADINICERDDFGFTPLIYACVSGSIFAVKYLLEKGADINKCSKLGLSPLSTAFWSNNINVAHFLIEHKADVNVSGKGKIAFTPLIFCCFNGMSGPLELLLRNDAEIDTCDGQDRSQLAIETAMLNALGEEFESEQKVDANIDCKTMESCIPLTVANSERVTFDSGINMDDRSQVAISSFQDVAKILFRVIKAEDLNSFRRITSIENVKLLLRFEANVNILDRLGFSALTWAILNENNEVIKLLLDKKANVNICGDNKEAFSPLTAASFKGSIENVKLLLRYKADIDKHDGQGVTPLIIAMKRNHADVIQILLKNNADVNSFSKDEFTRTPLIWASIKGFKDVVLILLDKAAEINKLDASGKTALTGAILNDKSDVVKLLLERKADVHIFAENKKSFIPLTAACYKGSVDNVKLLLKYKADINKHDGHGDTPLITATQENHIDVIKVLLENNADVNSFSKDKFTRTPLIWASLKGFMDVVLILLDNEADINKQDGSGRTALTWAISLDKSEVVKLLLEKKADVHIFAENTTAFIPLTAACYNGYKKYIKLLLSYNADINKHDGQGNTPLIYATREHHIDVIQILLENNADVNSSSKDEFTMTPLLWASFFGFKDIVLIFLDNGADINKLSAYGSTALTVAILNDKSEVVKLLLERKADVHIFAENKKSFIPLTAACSEGSVEIVKLLLSYKADINKHDGYGNTPLITATHKKHIDLIQILLENNADVNSLSKDEFTRTPLIWASLKGFKDVVLILLDNGAEINKLDAYGGTALTEAILNDNSDVVELLLEREAVVNIFAENKKSFIPLTAACSKGSVENVKLLLSYKADINKHDGYGDTPLITATQENHIDVIQILLNNNANVNSLSKNEVRRTPLIWASLKGFKDVVLILLDKGADINKQDASGKTALTWAILKDKSDVVKLLLERKADVNICAENIKAFIPLTAACYKGFIENVKLLLSYKADINRHDGYGDTPLITATRENHIDVVQILLKNNADVNSLSKNEVRRTPLIWASLKGYKDVFLILLDKGADINKQDSSGITALTEAIFNDKSEVVKLLLERGADVNICAENKKTFIPLTAACYKGYEEYIKVLLRYKADINKHDGYGYTALIISIMRNNINVIQILLKNNADINKHDGYGDTPLITATQENHIDVIQILLKNNADVNSLSENEVRRTPLIWASLKGFKDVVLILLDNGADINKINASGRTALTDAILNEKSEVVKLLLERGADVNICAENKKTFIPLTAACYKGFVENVKLLLSYKADINRHDGYGDTPLITATRENHIDVVQILLKNNADVNSLSKNEVRRTPLIWASLKGFKDVVLILLDKGADINKQDGSGRTALTEAILKDKSDVVELLLEREADVNICAENIKAFNPLTAACYKGSLENVKLLLSCNVDINKDDGRGQTPLIIAVLKQQIDIVQVLLQNNVDVNSSPEDAITDTVFLSLIEVMTSLPVLRDNGTYIKMNPSKKKALTEDIMTKHSMNIKLLLENESDVNIFDENKKAFIPLTAACYTGSVEIVKLLLSYRADINKHDGHGDTPVIIATKGNHIDVIQILLKNNADVNCFSKDDFTRTPLIWAGLSGCKDVVLILLDQGAGINKFDAFGRTALTEAIMKNKSEVVKCLLGRGADVNICAENRKTFIPLTAASYKGSVEYIKLLLRYKADIDKHDGYGDTPLITATQENHIDVIQILLKNNADVNCFSKDEFTSTPLIWASFYGFKDVVLILLDNGADINKINASGRTALTEAIWNDKSEVVKCLLAKEADVNICGEILEARTPLTAACYTGSVEKVRLLLRYKADINKYDGVGATPLIMAVLKNQIEVVKVLLENNVDVNSYSEGEFATTSLITASFKGFKDIVCILLEKGANINKLEASGRTALTEAILKDKNEVVMLLLESGADVNVCGEGEQAFSPLTAAISTGSLETVQNLLIHGADINKRDRCGRTALIMAKKKQDAIFRVLSKNANQGITIIYDQKAESS